MKNSLCKALAIVISLSLSHSVYAEKSSVVGAFDGVIWSNFEHPGMTEFYLTAEQNIEARYIFQDGDVESNGLLNNCDLTVLVLRCIWNDEYGTGDFVVEFKSDFSSFSGRWFDEISSDKRSFSDSNGHLWSGKRK